MSSTNLIIYNLETDKNSVVLSHTHDWIKSFALQIENVEVYSTHLGSTDLPSNVTLRETGGGTFNSRIKAILILFVSFLKIINNRKNTIVFHHMSPRTAVFPGLFFRLFAVKQALWYSHKSKPISLLLGSIIVNNVVSSIEGTIPISKAKNRYLGHGIDVSNAKKILDKASDNRSELVFLGRISPVKNLEKILDGIACSTNPKIKLTFAGPTVKDSDYSNLLTKRAKALNLNLRIIDPITHSGALEFLSGFSYFYSGMENSVDKSSLEAASVGCLILTTDKATLELTGMASFWNLQNTSAPKSVSEQIDYFESLKDDEISNVRTIIHKFVIESSDIKNTTTKILQILTNGNKK